MLECVCVCVCISPRAVLVGVNVMSQAPSAGEGADKTTPWCSSLWVRLETVPVMWG